MSTLTSSSRRSSDRTHDDRCPGVGAGTFRVLV